MFLEKDRREPDGDRSVQRTKNANHGNLLHFHSKIAEHKGTGIEDAHAQDHPAHFAAWKSHRLLGIRIIPRVGAIQTVWIIRLTSSVLIASAILVSKQPMHLPRTEVRWMVLGMGVFDTGAFVLSNLGMKMEQVAVISVLGSLYGAVTVGLAAIFLREHVSRWQWMGIVTIFLGIFLISR